LENISKVDLQRSSVAKRIKVLSEKNNLFLSHYEYRMQFEAAEKWQNRDRKDLSFDMGWENGQLKEYKYQSFRNDTRIGSFHPGHQNKWTAHELCHGLVGFAWNKDWEIFDHALAARLSELLPVVVYYFYDEADSRRCEKHRYPNQSFSYCEECESLSLLGSLKDSSHYNIMIEKGKLFFKREMESIKRAIETRRADYHIDHNLNLMSDGLAYASQQYKRISSDEYKEFIDLFYDERDYFDSLDDLMKHIDQVHSDLFTNEAVDYNFGDPNRHKFKELIWRLYELSADCNKELKADLMTLIDEVATKNNIPPFDLLLNGYGKLSAEWELPEIDLLFAVGYEVTKEVGYTSAIVLDGLEHCYPSLISYISDDEIREFISFDFSNRNILTYRFRDFLITKKHPKANLFKFECDMKFPKAIDEVNYSLKGNKAKTYKKMHKEIYCFDSNELQILSIEVGSDTDKMNLLAYRESLNEMAIIDLTDSFIVFYNSLADEIPISVFKMNEEYFDIANETGLIEGLVW
jgi:hypothetical protein